MFQEYQEIMFKRYNEARAHFRSHPDELIELEHYIANLLENIIIDNRNEINRDYNEASYLYPFWKNYPPDERGRQPVGDQYPWIEVGEHAIGSKLARLLPAYFAVSDYGIPAGPDQRFVLASDEVSRITNGYTNAFWLFSDIKSVGPRDDAFHAVMSHNQISGSGIWDHVHTGVKNGIIKACGQRASHLFYCSIPPIYVLSNGTVVPVINVVIKPLYAMLPADNGGQPLSKITLATIPNGLLLEEGPRYLQRYPSLFFPGKDDSGKNPLKIRARVDFRILQKIAIWRIKEIYMRDN